MKTHLALTGLATVSLVVASGCPERFQATLTAVSGHRAGRSAMSGAGAGTDGQCADQPLAATILVKPRVRMPAYAVHIRGRRHVPRTAVSGTYRSSRSRSRTPAFPAACRRPSR